MSCESARAAELINRVELEGTIGEEVPYQTLLVATSLVPHMIWADDVVIPVAEIPESIGGVVSDVVAGKVLKENSVEVLTFPAASAAPMT